MKGTIIGTDLLEYGDSVKVLEINTNTTIFNNAADYLDYDSFFAVLISNNITELHFIYNQDEAFITINEFEFIFEERLKTKCTENGIEYFAYKVPKNSVTVPYVEDSGSRFILRQAFDTTALVDETYCADKFEFFSLMRDSQYAPKTYQNPGTDLNMDTLDSISINPNGEPNLVKKSRYPNYNLGLYPAIFKLENTSELSDIKNSVNNTEYLLQEFVFDESNIVENRWNIIRSIDILYGNELDILNMGSYRTSTFVDLDAWNDEYQADGKQLTKKSRFKWVNKNSDPEQKINYHANGDSLILGTDGQYQNLDSVTVGSSIGSVDFTNVDGYSPSDDLPESYGKRWQSTIEYTQSTLSTDPTVVNKIKSQEISNLFIRITLEDGTQWNELAETTFYVESAGSDVTQFDKLNRIIVGDKLITYNKNTSEISKKEIVALDIVYDEVTAYELDVEPSDLFLVDLNSSELAIQHNYACSWCGWYSCGSYNCEYNCTECGGGQQKI